MSMPHGNRGLRREAHVEYLFLLGRILYGGFFINAGINHFRHLSMMSSFAGMKGVPAPKAGVAVSGLLILVGGASVLLGVQPVWGIVCIALFLVPVTLMMHNFWTETDQMSRINQRVNFEKNVALLGAGLMMVLMPQPWPLGIG
jgi:uncharacterized membrane protein YphA (DoxX/SURF4 family)